MMMEFEFISFYESFQVSPYQGCSLKCNDDHIIDIYIDKMDSPNKINIVVGLKGEELFNIEFYSQQLDEKLKSVRTKFSVFYNYIKDHIKEFDSNYYKFIDIDFFQKKFFSGMLSIEQLFKTENITKERIEDLLEFPTKDPSSFLSILGLNIKKKKRSMKRDGAYEYYTVIEICPNTMYSKMANKVIIHMDDDNVTPQFARVSYHGIEKKPLERWFSLKDFYYEKNRFICLGCEESSFFGSHAYEPIFRDFYKSSFILNRNGFALS